MEELRSHPTVKPVALVADAVRDCTRRRDIVLDTFSGSGTVIMAAERIGRRAHAMEIEPRYVDVAIRRWQAFTGKDALDLLTENEIGDRVKVARIVQKLLDTSFGLSG
jgi:DNA modification methylase